MQPNATISADESNQEHTVDERTIGAVVETPELRPSVTQEIQGRVDTTHPAATQSGLTLEAEERLAGRAWEIGRTRDRLDRNQDSSREARTRQAVGRGRVDRRRAFRKRAASVDPACDPDRADPRERLSRAALGDVNREAARVTARLPGWSRAAISRRMAERVVEGADVQAASLSVFEELRLGPGQIIPISGVSAVDRSEVSIAGEVTTLWKPSHPAIAQVGLIEDDSGRIKFTSWKRSRAPWVAAGERVQLWDVKRNRYEGRWSVAVTGWSRVRGVDRGQWWE